MTTPKKFFGNDVIRAMGTSGAALQIGLDGIGLVSLVVMEWDRFDYLKPAAFRLPVLIERSGLKNKQAFYRVEERCLKAGWLVKKPSTTRGPILYEAAIPEAGRLVRFSSDDDLNIDETRTNKSPKPGPIAGPITDQSRTNPTLSLSHSPSLDIPIPIPDPNAREAEPEDLFSPKPKTTETDAEVLGLLSVHVKWHGRDQENTEANKALAIRLYRTHGRLALHAAEIAAFEAHERVYPDRVADQLIALRADQSEAEKRTNKRAGPPDLYDQAVAIVASIGWERAAAIIGNPAITSAQVLDEFLWSNPDVWAKQLVERSKGAA